MPSPTNDFLNPIALVLPKVTEAVRDTMVSEIGSIIYNTTTNKIDICKAAVAAAASWEEVSSA